MDNYYEEFPESMRGIAWIQVGDQRCYNKALLKVSPVKTMGTQYFSYGIATGNLEENK